MENRGTPRLRFLNPIPKGLLQTEDAFYLYWYVICYATKYVYFYKVVYNSLFLAKHLILNATCANDMYKIVDL